MNAEDKPVTPEADLGAERQPAAVSTSEVPTDGGVGPLLAEASKADPSSARSAAETILRWAKEHRLFARQPMEDAAEVVLADDPLQAAPEQTFAVPAVADTLRRRAINLIAFNEHAQKIIVFTKSKVSAADLKVLPGSTNGVDVEYAVGGVPAVRGPMPQTHGVAPYFIHSGKYCCGSSIFPGNCMGAGTVGLFARDSYGVLYGVTNNHVTGACNHAQPGLPIMAPGPLDISDDGIDPFCIGRHARLIPINDGIPENMDIAGNMDASCFRVADSGEVCSMQGNLCDTPIVISEPEPSSIVEKVGRTTGVTRGRIVGQSISPLSVNYTLAEYRIQKSVYFNSVFIVEGLAGDFAKRGDSGALVMSVKPDGSRTSVGLVFAVDETKSLTYILSLPKIMEKLDLTICGDLNLI